MEEIGHRFHPPVLALLHRCFRLRSTGWVVCAFPVNELVFQCWVDVCALLPQEKSLALHRLRTSPWWDTNSPCAESKMPQGQQRIHCDVVVRELDYDSEDLSSNRGTFDWSLSLLHDLPHRVLVRGESHWRNGSVGLSSMMGNFLADICSG